MCGKHISFRISASILCLALHVCTFKTYERVHNMATPLSLSTIIIPLRYKHDISFMTTPHASSIIEIDSVVTTVIVINRCTDLSSGCFVVASLSFTKPSHQTLTYQQHGEVCEKAANLGIRLAARYTCISQIVTDENLSDVAKTADGNWYC